MGRERSEFKAVEAKILELRANRVEVDGMFGVRPDCEGPGTDGGAFTHGDHNAYRTSGG